MKGRRRQIFSRIYRRIEKNPSLLQGRGPCWVWQGPHSGNGRGGFYGRFSFEGVTASTHKTMYQVFYGPVAPKKQVDHRCKNRLCCNPLHLEQVTHRVNQRRKND